MSKDSRAGGKYSGNHTTLIPIATQVCDMVSKCESVIKISPGFIKAGLPSVNGKYRVKISDKEGGLLLSIRDNTCHQEVYVYTKDLQDAKLFISKGCKDLGLSVSFSNR
jgi:hypothetical protein